MELLAGKGGKGKIGQEGFTIYLIQTGRLRLHQRQRRLLQTRRRRRGGPAAAGTLAEGPRQQRRTGLAGLPDEPQQADRQRPGQPRNPLQGLDHDDQRPEGDRPERHDQGRHALRRHDRQALPPGDRQERQGKRQSDPRSVGSAGHPDGPRERNRHQQASERRLISRFGHMSSGRQTESSALSGASNRRCDARKPGTGQGRESSQ